MKTVEWPTTLADARERIIALEAENKRLRAALQTIALGIWNTKQDDGRGIDVHTFARAALERKPDV